MISIYTVDLTHKCEYFNWGSGEFAFVYESVTFELFSDSIETLNFNEDYLLAVI